MSCVGGSPLSQSRGGSSLRARPLRLSGHREGRHQPGAPAWSGDGVAYTEAAPQTRWYLTSYRYRYICMYRERERDMYIL